MPRHQSDGDETPTTPASGVSSEDTAKDSDLGSSGSEPQDSASATGSVGLRKTTLLGGGYLAVREILGILIRTVGVVVVTHFVGPASYGLYAGAAVFSNVVTLASQMGIEVYLIRQPTEPSKDQYDEAFTFLLVASMLLATAALALSLGAQAAFHVNPQAIHIFELMTLAAPVNVLWAPAQARIERAFGYRRMAWLELGGDSILYIVAASLAVSGAGAWSMAIGYVVWQSWLLVGSFILADLRPRWRWSRASMNALLRHGLSYSAAGWASSSVDLANPLIIGRYYGARGVGYVALAIRLVEALSFAQRAAFRLSLVALSRVQDDAARLRRGLEEGMVLQLLTTALPLAGFATVATVLVPLTFGRQWMPVLTVFSVMSVARMLNSPMMMTIALFYSKGRNSAVTFAAAASGVIVIAFGYPLVIALGLWGIGASRVISTVAWYYMERRSQIIVSHSRRGVLPWLIVFVPLAIFPDVAWPLRLLLALPAASVPFVPSLRNQAREYSVAIWQGLFKRGVLT
jgi:O-antigen/teichoic acid export membrane protein